MRLSTGAKGLSRLEEVAWLENLTDGRGVNVLSDVVGAGEGHIDPELVEQAHLGGLGLQFERRCVVRFGADSERKFAPDAESSLVREQAEHLLELEDAEGMLVHESSVIGPERLNQQDSRQTGCARILPIDLP